MLVHPDRVEESIKIEATEKFKVLGRIHTILSDTEKRKIYDESGQYDEESDEAVMRNWSDYWRTLFKEITVEDINNYEKNYKGSETEIKDLKRAYMDGNSKFQFFLHNLMSEMSKFHGKVQERIAAVENIVLFFFNKFMTHFSDESSDLETRGSLKKLVAEARDVRRRKKKIFIGKEENSSIIFQAKETWIIFLKPCPLPIARKNQDYTP